MEKIVDKTVTLRLVGLDGNAFSLIGAFQRQARKAGWTQEEIKKVIACAMSGNYDNLIRTLDVHCVDPDDSDEFEYDE